MAGKKVILPPSSFVLQFTLSSVMLCHLLKITVIMLHVMKNSFYHVMCFMFQKVFLFY
jgi:hypothetical protein